MAEKMTIEAFESWARNLGQMRAMALDASRVRLIQGLMPLTMETIPRLGSLLHLAQRLEQEADIVAQGLPPTGPDVDLIAMLASPKASSHERLRAVKARLVDQQYQLQQLDDRIAKQEAEEEESLASSALSLAAGTTQTAATKVGEALHRQRAQFAAAVAKLLEAQNRAAREVLVERLRQDANEIRLHITKRMLSIKELTTQLSLLLVSAALAVGVPRDLTSLKECFMTHEDLRELVHNIPSIPDIAIDEQLTNRALRSVDDKVKEIREQA